MDVQTDEWMEEPHLGAHTRRVHSVYLMPWIYPQTRRSIRKRHTSLKHRETPGAWALSATALGVYLLRRCPSGCNVQISKSLRNERADLQLKERWSFGGRRDRRNRTLDPLKEKRKKKTEKKRTLHCRRAC
jgi:hypothetical protein